MKKVHRAQDAPHSIGGALADQFSWYAATIACTGHGTDITPVRNYDHVAGLWAQKGWIPQSAVALARAHYAAYMVRRVDGLRIITLNTDLCTCFFQSFV
jgi:sphingomyelin phosphodiesterase